MSYCIATQPVPAVAEAAPVAAVAATAPPVVETYEAAAAPAVHQVRLLLSKHYSPAIA